MNPEILNKAKQLRALFLDVDGVLTDGSFYLSPSGEETKRFHVHDGLGLQRLQQQGIQIAIISGRTSAAVTHRMRELNITHVYQGITSKLVIYTTLREQFKLTDAEIGYMGDDLPDLPPLEQAGLSIAPANALPLIQQKVNWVTKRCGGNAAVREVCDTILLAQQHEK